MDRRPPDEGGDAESSSKRRKSSIVENKEEIEQKVEELLRYRYVQPVSLLGMKLVVIIFYSACSYNIFQLQYVFVFLS
jgi:hypothetical protein